VARAPQAGETALHGAGLVGSDKAVAALLHARANPNFSTPSQARDNDDNNAADNNDNDKNNNYNENKKEKNKKKKKKKEKLTDAAPRPHQSQLHHAQPCVLLLL
jgi:hypothetical protein